MFFFGNTFRHLERCFWKSKTLMDFLLWMRKLLSKCKVLERSCHPSTSSCVRCKVINVCWIIISPIPYTGRICERKWIATSRLHIFLFGKCLKVGRIWLYTISGKLAFLTLLLPIISEITQMDQFNWGKWWEWKYLGKMLW